MERKVISGMILTLLIISMLTLAFRIEPVYAADYPSVFVDPEYTHDNSLTPGSTYVVSIMTDYTGDDITAYQFTLSYNPSILNGVSVTNGDLIVGGSACFSLGTFNNTAGELSRTVAFFFLIAEVASGPGTLAYVTFTVVGIGCSDIILGSNTLLKGWDAVLEETYDIVNAATMPTHIGHGYFNNTSPPPPAITATVNITPNSLNLKSKGKWITCYIELPEGNNVSDIDISTILLNNTVSVDLDAPAEIGDYDEDGILEHMVKFDRAEAMALLSVGEAILTITGEVDGTPFEGSDTIRVK